MVLTVKYSGSRSVPHVTAVAGLQCRQPVTSTNFCAPPHCSRSAGWTRSHLSRQMMLEITQNYHYNGPDDAGADNNAGDDTVDTDWRWEPTQVDACKVGLWPTPGVTGSACCSCPTPAKTGRRRLAPARPAVVDADADADANAGGSPAAPQEAGARCCCCCTWMPLSHHWGDLLLLSDTS